MADIKKFGVIPFSQIEKELVNIGINLKKVPNINILGQAPIMMTGLLAIVQPKYIELDDFGNPYIVIGGRRKSLAGVVFYVDEHGQVWVDYMIRKNEELQNNTGLKKNDLKLAAKGWGLSSAPFKMDTEDNKRNVLNQFIGKFAATEESDGTDDIIGIDMPLYCYQVKTKPKDAKKIENIDEKDSTSKMIAAKKSIEAHLNNK